MSQSQAISDLVNRLKQAVEGLTVISESDYPLEVLLWQCQAAPSVSQLLEQMGKPQDSPVEVVEITRFFAPMTQEQDWFEPEDRAIAQKFQALVKLLSETLTEIKVYRVGTIAIDVYIVGKTALENWIILATKVIET
jgi:Nuclease A inhibitor-like protein